MLRDSVSDTSTNCGFCVRIIEGKKRYDDAVVNLNDDLIPDGLTEKAITLQEKKNTISTD